MVLSLPAKSLCYDAVEPQDNYMACNVGCRRLECFDVIQNTAVPLVVLYPTDYPQRKEPFGPYELNVAVDAPPAGSNRTLIVVSHGNGGTPWAYRDLAVILVRAGFVVALPDHIGNSRTDNSLEGTAANLQNRPRHLRLTIDAVFADVPFGYSLRRDRVGLIGHSIGGYTALSVAGGQPWTSLRESENGAPYPLKVSPDPRVRALVLLAPATPWFQLEGSLSDVQIPILMRTGGNDEVTPDWHADIVKRGVRHPEWVDHKCIAGAGHFSFMSVFPPSMTRPDFAPSQDPEGFDRADIQPSLHGDIRDFLQRVLEGPHRP
jgi:predicted dienelactone hydrolase